MDIFAKFENRLGPIGDYAEKSPGYFAFPKLEGEIGNRMKFMGKEKIVWSLNNYLGLANHPEVRKADADAAAQFGLAYPLFKWLTDKNENGVMDAEIKWNFTKFLLDEKGKLLAVFPSKVKPMGEEITAYLK